MSVLPLSLWRCGSHLSECLEIDIDQSTHLLGKLTVIPAVILVEMLRWHRLGSWFYWWWIHRFWVDFEYSFISKKLWSLIKIRSGCDIDLNFYQLTKNNSWNQMTMTNLKFQLFLLPFNCSLWLSNQTNNRRDLLKNWRLVGLFWFWTVTVSKLYAHSIF